MMIETTNKIKRLSLADEVAIRLQAQITNGTYKVGDKLPPEPELMTQFGVGRSSIREAIKILSNNGVVKVQQGMGTFVISQTGFGEPLSQKLQRAKFDEVNDVRLVLEEKIVEKAVTQRSNADLKKMKAAIERRKKYALSQNLAECIQADIDFHVSIAEASGNSIMTEIYRTVAMHLKDSFIEIFKTTDPFIETQEWHEQLLQGIVDSDVKTAVNAAFEITRHSKTAH